MSTLREAAQAVVDGWDGKDPETNFAGLVEELRAALAQPETEAPRDEWRAASVDCRTCRHFAKRNCWSTFACTNGWQYKPTNPVQIWERTP